MRKITITLFLICLSSITVFSQNADDDFGKVNHENSNVDIEQQCYNSTNSLAEFKRCVERQRLPICPDGWTMEEFHGNPCRKLPCRYEREDGWEKRQIYPIDKMEHHNFEDEMLKEKLRYRRLANEIPEFQTSDGDLK